MSSPSRGQENCISSFWAFSSQPCSAEKHFLSIQLLECPIPPPPSSVKKSGWQFLRIEKSYRKSAEQILNFWIFRWFLRNEKKSYRRSAGVKTTRFVKNLNLWSLEFGIFYWIFGGTQEWKELKQRSADVSKRPDFQAYQLPVWVTQPRKVKRPEQLPTRSWDTDQNITDIFLPPFLTTYFV